MDLTPKKPLTSRLWELMALTVALVLTVRFVWAIIEPLLPFIIGSAAILAVGYLYWARFRRW